LFLISAASTGLAVVIVLARLGQAGGEGSFHRLERALAYYAVLELIFFAIFAASLRDWLRPIWEAPHGKLLLLGPPILGILLPLALHVRTRLTGGDHAVVAAVLVLLGGFVLRSA